MGILRTAALAAMTVAAGCGEEGVDGFLNAGEVKPMDCAKSLSDKDIPDPKSSDAPLSERVSLTRDRLESTEVVDRSGGATDGETCYVQPYYPSNPETYAPLDADVIQNYVDTRLVGMLHRTDTSFRSAVSDETLEGVEFSPDCSTYDNDSGAPLCVVACPTWAGVVPSVLVVTDTCETVVPIDLKYFEEEVPVINEPEEEDTGTDTGSED